MASVTANQIVLIDRDKCTGCGNCVSLCPRGILEIDGEGLCAVSDERRCDRLRGCMRVCPTGAIHIA